MGQHIIYWTLISQKKCLFLMIFLHWYFLSVFFCCFSFIKAISHLCLCITVILPSLKILINVWNLSSLLMKTLIDWLSLRGGQDEALVDGAHSDTVIFLEYCWRWVAPILNTREPISSTDSNLHEYLWS